MHIAILSDPNNFHTLKWAKALDDAGAQVTVFSFEKNLHAANAVRISPPYAVGGRYTYLAYLKAGRRLAAALKQHKVDLVNALNITPFGVWAAQSSFRPVIASAIGADILEYPPQEVNAPYLRDRSWANVTGRSNWWSRQKHKRLRQYYREKVKQALQYADLITGDNQLLVDSIRDWFGVEQQKLRVLRWGVEPELFEVDTQRLTQITYKIWYCHRPARCSQPTWSQSHLPRGYYLRRIYPLIGKWSLFTCQIYHALCRL